MSPPTSTTVTDRAPRGIGTSASVVLDALRLGAAGVVLVFHVSSQWTTAYPAWHEALGKASHAAVVAFFVISGYVIAFTTARITRGPRQYAVARLSRLYSVLGPALVLTALVEAVVVRTNGLLAARYVHAHSAFRYLLTLGFSNEAGWWSAAPPLNSPLWSLSYEGWYYVLFGIWYYRSAGWKTTAWLVAAGLLAGPKILLLLPIWLFGVLAFRRRGPRISGAVGWGVVSGLLLLAGAAVAYLPAFPAEPGARPLFMAGQFATDWLVGALVALAIWSIPASAAAPPRAWVPAFRKAADLSFPLYVLHFPLIVLWRAVLGWRDNDLGQMWQVILGVGLAAGALGLVLERQRPRWVRFFAGLLRFLPPRRPAAASSGHH